MIKIHLYNAKVHHEISQIPFPSDFMIVKENGAVRSGCSLLLIRNSFEKGKTPGNTFPFFIEFSSVTAIVFGK